MEGRVAGVPRQKDHRFLTDLYQAIEARFDVNALRYEGLHVWPLVRLQLGRSFKESASIPDAGAARREHARSARADVTASRRRVEQDQGVLAAAPRPTFVVQTKLETYYQPHGDRFLQPILDPVADDLTRHGTVQRLAIEPLRIPYVHEPLRLDLDAFVASREWTRFSAPPELDEGLAQIETFVREAWPECPLKRRRILARLDGLRQRRDFFHDVYRRLEPEYVVLSSFTGWMDALWAAKDLGIPIIDVQHGGQGEVHYPTTHFWSIPETGYHLLPDVLWLWGNINRRFASPWLPGGARSRHLPVVGGHRGVARWDSDRQAGRLATDDAAFLEQYAGGRNVLVTLSYAIDPLMPEALFEAIERTPQLHWLIRLHPIHRPREARDQISVRLEAAGALNFSIDEPTNVQIWSALYASSAHLTPFSTTVREAMAFGVPSAITHPVGELLFREEIKTGSLEIALSGDEVVDFVTRHAERVAEPGIRRDAIEVSEQAVDDVVTAARHVRDRALPLRSTHPGPRAVRAGASVASFAWWRILLARARRGRGTR